MKNLIKFFFGLSGIGISVDLSISFCHIQNKERKRRRRTRWMKDENDDDNTKVWKKRGRRKEIKKVGGKEKTGLKDKTMKSRANNLWYFLFLPFTLHLPRAPPPASSSVSLIFFAFFSSSFSWPYWGFTQPAAANIYSVFDERRQN